jgi:hypothetical protein
MIKWKQEIMYKDSLVTEATMLSRFILNLQLERSGVALALFLDKRSGKNTDLSQEFANTDQSLNDIEWKGNFGKEKIFENKLRFQIRMDDFRWVNSWFEFMHLVYLNCKHEIHFNYKQYCIASYTTYFFQGKDQGCKQCF